MCECDLSPCICTLQVKCGVAGLYDGVEVVLGPDSGLMVPGPEQQFINQKMRPGSGVLSVQVLPDGPTRVLQVRKEPIKTTNYTLLFLSPHRHQACHMFCNSSFCFVYWLFSIKNLKNHFNLEENEINAFNKSVYLLKFIVPFNFNIIFWTWALWSMGLYCFTLNTTNAVNG